jgi:hypothetical protein
MAHSLLADNGSLLDMLPAIKLGCVPASMEATPVSATFAQMTAFDVSRFVAFKRYKYREPTFLQTDLLFNFQVMKMSLLVKGHAIEVAVKLMVFLTEGDCRDAAKRIGLLSDLPFTETCLYITSYEETLSDGTVVFCLETWMKWLDEVRVDRTTFAALKQVVYNSTRWALQENRIFSDAVTRNMGVGDDKQIKVFDYQDEGHSFGDKPSLPSLSDCLIHYALDSDVHLPMTLYEKSCVLRQIPANAVTQLFVFADFALRLTNMCRLQKHYIAVEDVVAFMKAAFAERPALSALQVLDKLEKLFVLT